MSHIIINPNLSSDMKKIITFCLLLSPLFLLAQTSGKIKYTETMKVEIPDRLPKEFRDRIPKERKINKELYFNKTTSTYKNGVNIRRGEGEAGDGDGRRFRFRGGGGGNTNAITYKDLENNLGVDNRDIMGKQFIIEETLEKSKWKVTGQKKTILGYMVMEATSTINDTIPVTAFFAPQIPISNGPGMHQGLPGMILEINIDSGRRVIAATEVELINIEAKDLEKPSTGKKVTKEEFNEIRKEKMKEMREQRGGRGGVRFRTGG